MKERRQVGLLLCFGFLFVISVRTSLAQTEVSGEVAGVWKLLESPFIVKDDISVSIGDTLRIEPGVKILFDGHFMFSIKGLLQAVGADSDSITFTHRTPGSTWAGIRFSEADKNSILEYCTIEYSDQSGITVFKSSITVRYNTIRNNQDIGSQFQVGMGGGIYISLSAPLIAGNYIVNNSAARGGGIEYNEDGGPNRCEILNNIIVSNSASTLGGGIRVFGADFGATPLIRNNVLDMNTAQSGGNIYVFPGARPEIVNNIITNSSQGSGIFDLGNADIRHNDVWNNQPFDYEFTNPGIGDFSADPLFVGGAPFDYHLQEASPCIDAGDPNTPFDPDNSLSDIGAFFFGEDVPPIPVAEFEAFASDGRALLQWRNPNLIDFASTRIVRRIDRFPNNPDDGDVVFDGHRLLFQDTGLENGIEYLYAAFVQDKAGQFSEAFLVSVVPETRVSNVIRVPIDYITIQEGLNAASPGDTVMVYPGNYSPTTNGEVFPVALADSVVLMSESDRDSTIVDAEQTNLVFLGATDATIMGFTITGGWNSSITAPGISGPNGGGILCTNLSNMKICNNRITNNVVDGPFFPDGSGGGVFCRDAEVVISNNIIADNFAERDHGGISCSGSPSTPERGFRAARVIIENNQIVRNRGGGLALEGVDAVVKANLIAENSVSGLGIPIPGGVALVGFFWGSVKLINNTIAFNFNSQFPANISGVRYQSGVQPIELINNIIWGHDDGGLEIDVANTIPELAREKFTVRYCLVDGGYPGVGNFAMDPKFKGGSPFDYHLTPESPGIDRGDPDSPKEPDGTRADIGGFTFEHIGEASIIVQPSSLVIFVDQGEDAVQNIQVLNQGNWPLQFQWLKEPGNNLEGAAEPDEFGYSWIDSDNPNGPVFEWIEIDAVGIQGSIREEVELPFPFIFYDKEYRKADILYYGMIGFSNPFPFTPENNTIPGDLHPNNFIAAFWDDFKRDSQTGFLYHLDDRDQNRFIVEYVDFIHDDPNKGADTFQIILNQDGSILLQYKDVTKPDDSTIGIENLTGQFGVQIAHNENFLHDSLAVKVFKGIYWLETPQGLERIEPGSNKMIPISINSRFLRPGTYDGKIVLDTNDPDDAFFDIPLYLNVNASEGDVTPPGIVTDLSIVSVEDSSVTLQWTAPGDDGDLGIAFQYELRYAVEAPMQDTSAWWESATPVTALPSPSFSGKVDSVKVTELNTSISHYFAIRTSDEAENVSVISNIAFSLPVSVESTDANIIPRKFDLSQNYPNPFNPETTIKYQIPKAADVSLEIYNLLGQRVAMLVDERQPAGFYATTWDGKDDFGSPVASGVYLYRLQAGEFVQVRKLALLK